MYLVLSVGLPPDFPRTFLIWISTGLFSPDFDEQSCVNRSWINEKSFFYELVAGFIKIILVN